MTVSVKMLAEIALHAQTMADEARAMAEAMQAVVNDCAEQLAAKREAEGAARVVETPSTPSAPGTETNDQPWVAEAEATIPEPMPVAAYTIAEVRAFVAERTNRENREQVKAILNSFGVSKLTDLPEDKYVALMQEVAKL